MRLAWVTDSASCIELSDAKQNDIHVVPLSVIFDGQSYKDMFEISEDTFYEWISEGRAPSTSQPPIGEFVELYTRLKEQGYDAAIAVHLSETLSGTINASRMAADMVDFPVHIVDSGLVAKPVVFLLEEGMRAAREGKTIEEIVDRLHEMRENIVGYIMLSDLNFLHRGGRLSASSALIGTLLQIKPILVLKYQTLELFEKVRTARRAKEFLHNLLDTEIASKAVKEISVVHAHYLDEARNWVDQLKEKYSQIPITLSTLGTAVGVHSGPRAIGLTWRT